MRTDRRSLFRRATGLVGALTLRSVARVEGSAEEPFRISLAEWSLHRTIRAGKLDPRDFAVLARDRKSVV